MPTPTATRRDDPGHPPPCAPIFVGGAPRSGTTLVRAILDTHPAIACGPELRAVAALAGLWSEIDASLPGDVARAYHLKPATLRDAFAGTIAGFLAPHRQRSGKPRIAEKTPSNVRHFAELHRLFPDSPLVHVIRDGRDVVTSLLGMDWIDPRTGQPFDYVRNARAAAHSWVDMVTAGRAMAALPDAGSCYLELRYEDIVARPEPTLKRLFDFLGEPWTDAVLGFHANPRNTAGSEESSADQIAKPLYAASVGRWRRDLAPADRQAVREVAGPLLMALGYCRDLDW